MTFKSVNKCRLLLVSVVVVALALGVHLSLAMGLKKYVNENVLGQMKSYHGSIVSVDVNPLAGTYTLKDMHIYQAGRNQDSDQEPFVSIERFETDISWWGLLQGKVWETSHVSGIVVNLIDAKKKEDQQLGADMNWLEVFSKIIPSNVDTLTVDGGRINFTNFDTEPPVNMQVTDIAITLTNLNNRENKSGEKIADFGLRATVFEGAELEAKASFDSREFDDLSLTTAVRDIELEHVNSLVRGYAKMDFKSGRGEIRSEIEVNDGKIRGYISPFFEDINILSWSQDVVEQGDNPINLAWEGILGVALTFLTNIGTDQVATRITVTGTLTETKINTWYGFFGLVKNAFISGLDLEFEKIDLNNEVVKDKQE